MLRSDKSSKHWGRWYLSRSTPLSLNIDPDQNNNPQEITLIRINSPAKVLCWINHLIASKMWITLDDIRDFMVACKELQDNGMTPKGEKNEDIDWGY